MSIFEAAKSNISKAWIESTFHAPGAFWAGNDFKTINPMRSDRSIGSFGISASGVYYDFADGSRGDVLDLLAEINGTTPYEEASRLAGPEYKEAPRMTQTAPTTPYHQTETETIKPDWVEIPEGREPQARDTCTYKTLYHTAAGKRLFYVIRHDFPGDGRKKEIFPVYWIGNAFHKGLPPGLTTRPLMRISPSLRPVLLVEGEKCCEEARKVAGSFVDVTTWHGGSGAAHKAELDLLQGRDVILWPDNDETGIEAMAKIGVRLQGVAKSVATVTIPDGREKGWDIADAIKEGTDVMFVIGTASKVDEVPEESIDNVQDIADGVYSHSDMGNAERMIDMYGHAMRFNVDQQKWMLCDGRTWYSDDNSSMTPIVKGVIESIANDADKDSEYYAHSCKSMGKIKSMLEMASRMPGIPVKEEHFDPIPYHLNCLNAVVDLRTGEMVKPKAEWLMSKRGTVDYLPDAECPLFMKFLDEITLARQEMVEFMQRWFGYCLTAEMSAQVFTIFYGNGANGKSTLVELISKIMGSYSRTAPPDTFVQKQAGGVPNDVAALRGSRLVLTTETEANARLAESRIKNLTGGDRVSARFMRAEYFEFQPTWKIIISTNHRPRVSGADHGIWRRIVLVPFDFIATKDKMDPMLPRKLWEEKEGILAWMVRGAAKWYADGEGRGGLKVSDSLADEVAEYKSDEDLIGRFMEDECMMAEEIKRFGAPQFIRTAEMHGAFVKFANDMGEKYAGAMSASSFSRAMRERGYESVKKFGGIRCFANIYPRSLYQRPAREETTQGDLDGR